VQRNWLCTTSNPIFYLDHLSRAADHILTGRGSRPGRSCWGGRSKTTPTHTARRTILNVAPSPPVAVKSEPSACLNPRMLVSTCIAGSCARNMYRKPPRSQQRYCRAAAPEPLELLAGQRCQIETRGANCCPVLQSALGYSRPAVPTPAHRGLEGGRTCHAASRGTALPAARGTPLPVASVVAQRGRRAGRRSAESRVSLVRGGRWTAGGGDQGVVPTPERSRSNKP
jgi:hypothetical protein